MSIKVLVVLSLVAVAASSPTLPGLLGGPHKEVSRGHPGLVGIQLGNLDIGKTLGYLLRGLIGHKHVARNNSQEILNMNIGSFNDVCTLLTKVVVSMCDTVEASIRELGILLSRALFGLLKICMCLGRDGGNNPICRNDVNLLVGVKAQSAGSVQAIVQLFELSNARTKLNTIIAIHTRGRGVSACRGSIRVVFNLALDLVTRLEFAISRGSLGKADFTFCFRRILSLFGAIGNSRQKGAGLQIVRKIVPICNQWIVKANYPDVGDITDVEKEIDLGNQDKAPWAVSDVDVSVNVKLGDILGGLFRGLRGVTRLARNLIQDILGIVINSVNDVFNLALKIILGIGGLLDSTVAGLGSLLVRIVAGLLRIVLCFLGLGGKYGVCGRSWDIQVGVNGNVNSIDDVIKYYGLRKCRAQVDQYINVYTKGKGINSCTGSVKILLQTSVTLSEIVQTRKWDRNTVVIVFEHITYLLGAVGNSNARGVGTSVCKRFVPDCNKYLTIAGFKGLGDNTDNIWKIVEDSNNDDHCWSADVVGDDNNNNTGFIINDSGNSGNNGNNGGQTGNNGSNGGQTGNNGNNGNTGGHTGGNTGGQTGNNGNTGVTATGGTGLIGGLIKSIFGVINGVTRLASGALDSVLKISIGALNDVFSLTINLSLVLQVTLNNLVAGLGSLFVRLVACIIKIAVCLLGLPGDRGVCARGWNARFGVDGELASNADALAYVKHFRLDKAQDELNAYIIKISKGKGIQGTSGSVYIVLSQMNTLTTYITNYKKISKETVTQTFVIMTMISASVSNSRKRDSGKEIIEKIIPQCGPYFKKYGYPDITSQATVMKTTCGNANGDNVDWNGNGNYGGDTIPSSGNTSPPGGKDNTTPYSGGNHNTTPTGNDNDKATPSSGNDNATPSGDNYNTTPYSGGNDKTTSPGKDNDKATPSSGNNNATPSGGNEKTTPDGGEEINPPEGEDTNPAESEDTNPAEGEGTDSAGDDNTTTAESEKITPPNEDTYPTGNDYTTPAKSKEITPVKDDTYAAGAESEETTPANEDTYPTGNDYTTPAKSEEITPVKDDTYPARAESEKTTPAGGKDTTPAENDSTTPSSGGSNGNDCGKDIGVGIQVIPGVSKLSTTIIKDLISIRINAFVDVINLVSKLTLALGGVIDSIISGLGSILVRIVAVIFKIGYCVNGYGSDKSICTKDWNAQFGITGDASTAVDLLALYRVDNCKSDITTMINTYTKGKGIDSTSGLIKILLQRVTELGNICSGSITKQHFSTVSINIFTIFGSITNSYKAESGTVIIKKVLPVCNRFYVQQGFSNIQQHQNTIISNIKLGANIKFDWTIVKSGDNTQSDKLVTKVKEVFHNAKGKNNVNKPSLNAVLKLSAPQNFNEVCTFGVQVVQALGGFLDEFINGLGTLIVRMVGALINYIVAILGAARNGKCFVAQKAYYSSFGVTVSGKTWASISTGFKINNCKADLDAILNAYTKNQGLKSLRGARLLIFQCAYSLADIVAKGTAIVEADLTAVFWQITNLLGGFANSLSAGVGKSICDNMLPTTSYYLEQNGYPSFKSTSSLYTSIGSCNNVAVPWYGTASTTTN